MPSRSDQDLRLQFLQERDQPFGFNIVAYRGYRRTRFENPIIAHDIFKAIFQYEGYAIPSGDSLVYEPGRQVIGLRLDFPVGGSHTLVDDGNLARVTPGALFKKVMD
jgi:hypothetical protein